MAVAVGGKIAVVESAAGNGPPKAQWSAHNAQITCLRRTVRGLALLSGATDGTVCLWDLKSRPSAPAASIRASTHPITSLVHLSDTVLATASSSGAISTWDLGNRGGAGGGGGGVSFELIDSVSVDGTGVLQMEPAPQGRALAVGTLRGLYTVAVGALGGIGEVAAVMAPRPAPLTSVKWNASTGEIYAGQPDGTIAVFRQQA